MSVVSTAIGKGVVMLIQQHEPNALRIGPSGSRESRERVLTTLADTMGGLFAFAVTAGGEEEARTAMLLVLDRIGAATPNILRKTQASMHSRG